MKVLWTRLLMRLKKRVGSTTLADNKRRLKERKAKDAIELLEKMLRNGGLKHVLDVIAPIEDDIKRGRNKPA